MKTLLLFLSLIVTTSQAATVRLYFTDPLTNDKDTNAFYITPIGTNVLSSGGVVGRGVTTRYVPASNGYRTNTLAVGHYSITNRSLGSGVVIRVPDSSSLYDYTNILISGYNIFVTITNGDSGTSGALTNNDTRAVTLTNLYNPKIRIVGIGDFVDFLTNEIGAFSLATDNVTLPGLHVRNADFYAENIYATAGIFSGSGAGLTSVHGSNSIAAGTISTNRMDATAYAAFVGGGTTYTNNASGLPGVVVGSGIGTNMTTLATQAGLAAGSYPIDGIALGFSELYSAWVSKYGDNSTGTVGKRERPFAGVSNAVYAVKTALGSVNTNGVVYIGAGLFDEHLVNLQRTNLPGISLIGQGGVATLLTSRSTSQLTNIGALVTVGHSSRVIGVSISNDMSANFKQAAIGYDTSRSASLLGAMVVPTNVFINVPIGRGNSDVGYFYDAAGPGDFDITMVGCDWLSKWDAVFLSTLGTDGQFKIKNSNIKVLQPDGYNFPGLGSGAGRARAVYIGDGNLSVENSSIVAVGGTTSTNEVTGLTFFGATIGYTNIGSFIDAQGSAGTILRESTSEPTQYLGKITPDQISGTFQSITNSGKYNGIKVYRAWITQTGTAAPSATVLENSLGATPTFGRSDVGIYTINTSALFTSGKTLVRFTLSTSSSGGFNIGSVEWATASQIILRTVDDAQVGGLADAIMNNGSSVEILVYP